MSDQEVREQVQEDSDADLEAGFNAVMGGGQPAPQTQPDPDKAPGGDAVKAAEDATASTEPAATEVEPAKAEPQKDQTEDLRRQVEQLQSSIRNIAGNFGGLKSELQALRKGQQASPAAETAAKKIEVTLKRLQSDYPELAEALAADLNDVLGAAAPAAQQEVDLSAVRDLVESRVSSVQQQTARDVLDSVHPTWEADIAETDGAGQPLRVQARDGNGMPVVDAQGNPVLVLKPSQQFTQWLQKKGDAFQQSFYTTNSAAFLVRAISEFKSTVTPKPKAEPSADQLSKQARLRSAVTPVGKAGSVQQPEIDEDAAMAIGFASVRGTSR